MLRTQLAALTLAVTTLAASGCGGSSKDTANPNATTGTTTAGATGASVSAPSSTAVKVATGNPLSRTRFIAAADAICAKTNTKLAAVTVITTREFARQLPQVVLYDATEINELSKLVPPTSLARDWSTMLNDFHQFTEYSRTVAKDVQAHNMKAVSPIIVSAQNLRQELNRVATRAGFKHCNRTS
jgi:hypothetical protein